MFTNLSHAAYCCILHGCQFEETFCPVYIASVAQSAACDRCDGGVWQLMAGQTSTYRLHHADGAEQALTQAGARDVLFNRRAYGRHEDVVRMDETVASPWREVPLDVAD